MRARAKVKNFTNSRHILFQVLGEVEEDNYPDGSADNQKIHNFVHHEVPAEQRIEIRGSLCPDNEDVIEFHANESQKDHHQNQSLTVAVAFRNPLDKARLAQQRNRQEVED